MPSISIVIPLFNKKNFIDQTIAAFQMQLESSDEIIVVDDVSTDESYNVASKWKSSQIKLFQLSENSGPASARNYGAKVAKSNFLLFFDADDLPHPTLIACLKQAITLYPHEKIFSFDISFEGRGEKVTWQADTNVFPQLSIQVFGKDSFVDSCLSGKPLCTASSTCIEVNAFFRATGFQDGLRYSEDPELWARLSSEHNIVYINNTLAIYHHVIQSQSHQFRGRPGAVHSFVETLLRLDGGRNGKYKKLAILLVVKNVFFCIAGNASRSDVRAYIMKVNAFIPVWLSLTLRVISFLPSMLLLFLFTIRDKLRSLRIGF